MTIITYTGSFKNISSTNIFGLGAKTKYRQVATIPLSLPLTAYPTPGSGGNHFSAKSTAKNDPTTNCSHFVAERSVSVEQEKSLTCLKGWKPPPPLR